MSQKLGGRYELIRQIGGGGMAIVYLATDLFLDRQVAVKVLRDEFVESDEFIRRFQKEAKAIASLNHPNIVSVYDFNSSNSPIYLVMEYVEGKTLKEKIVQEGNFAESLALDVCEQIANGLLTAHSAKIIHKDIKSQNILIDKEDKIKITDFGIAQILSNATITHNKGILGSAHYFSPEQARGDIVTYKSDIYSLGIVLYEILTGELPFTGDNPVTVALKHIQEKPKPPRAINPDLSKDIEAIVLKCLSKHPEARFQNIEEFLLAIRALKNGNTNSTQICNNQNFSDKHNNIEDTLALPKLLVKKEQEMAVEEKNEIKKRSLKKMPLILLLILIAMIFSFATVAVLNGLNHSVKEQVVPEFESLSMQRAKELAEKYDIILVEEDRVFDDSYPEGHIVSQSPKYGEQFNKDNPVVKVIVSKGSSQISVPNFVGMTQDEAESKIKSRGLEVGKLKFESSEEVEKNRVISQSPSPGIELNAKEKVNLVISLGNTKKEVTVPNLLGLTLENAKITLENKGLFLGIVDYQEDRRKTEGIVLSQSITSKEKVKLGSSINISINKISKLVIENKETQLSFVVPSSGWLTVEQKDASGIQTIYQTNANAGDVINESISYKGTGSINIFIDGELVKEVTLP